MIKFGSRTELYVPVGENTKCLVKVGDKVKAGLTPIIRYEAQNTNQRAGLNV
jgi:phosphatidylserine decarboxylase